MMMMMMMMMMEGEERETNRYRERAEWKRGGISVRKSVASE